MAAAFFNVLADPGRGRAAAAGTQPDAQVNAEAVAAMKEVGIDISGERPRLLTEAMTRQANILVTMGCGEACPVGAGARVLDWPLMDLRGQPMERIRAARDDIKHRVQALIAAEDLAPNGAHFSESG